MKTNLDKEEIRTIAQVLIAKSGESFDFMAFDECDGLISSEDADRITDEIQRICSSTLERLNKKYSLDLGPVNSTKDIIEEILYE